MRAVVTGANGLIGAHLVRVLLAGGHTVNAFVRKSSDLRALDGMRVQFVYGDVLQPATLHRAFDGCEILFHAAAVYAYAGYTREQLVRVAVEGTRNILRAAREAGVRRVVLTSSSVVLGSSENPEVRNERHRMQDPNPAPYIVAKIAQEQAAFPLAKDLGLELIAVLPTITVGPHDSRLGPSNGMICSYLADPWKITWPGGCNIVAAEDVARGHLLAALHGEPGKRYVLGSENLEWPEIHRHISEIAHVDGPIFQANHTSAFLAATAQEIFARLTRTKPLTTRLQAAMVGRFYWYDHSAAARRFDYQPGLARVALAGAIEWLARSSHLPRWVRTRMRAEAAVT
jgi:dihydroflavonol-4-reductase